MVLSGWISKLLQILVRCGLGERTFLVLLIRDSAPCKETAKRITSNPFDLSCKRGTIWDMLSELTASKLCLMVSISALYYSFILLYSFNCPQERTSYPYDKNRKKKKINSSFFCSFSLSSFYLLYTQYGRGKCWPKIKYNNIKKNVECSLTILTFIFL